MASELEVLEAVIYERLSKTKISRTAKGEDQIREIIFEVINDMCIVEPPRIEVDGKLEDGVFTGSVSLLDRRYNICIRGK